MYARFWFWCCCVEGSWGRRCGRRCVSWSCRCRHRARSPVAPGVDLVETDEGGAVWLHGMVAFAWAASDEAGRRLAGAGLVATGAAKQRQVAEAFAVNETTVWRWRSERDRAGVAGLVTDRPGPKGAWKLTGELVDRIVALDAEGLSGRQIARQVGVSDSSVRKVLAEHRNVGGEQAAVPVAAGEPPRNGPSRRRDGRGGRGGR